MKSSESSPAASCAGWTAKTWLIFLLGFSVGGWTILVIFLAQRDSSTLHLMSPNVPVAGGQHGKLAALAKVGAAAAAKPLAAFQRDAPTAAKADAIDGDSLSASPEAAAAAVAAARAAAAAAATATSPPKVAPTAAAASGNGGNGGGYKPALGHYNGYDATVIITVECLAFHDWQTVLVVDSLERLRRQNPDTQRFDIHRMCSCKEPEKGWIRAFVNTTAYSPPMSPHPKTRYEFPTLNKPRALLSWLEGPGRNVPDDHELIITDPDFVFLNTLPLGVSRPGRPVGGHYRFGAGWLSDARIRKHCRGKCDDLVDKHDEVERHWTAGPPLFIRKGDFRRIVPHWFNITEQFVFEGNPKSSWDVPGGWLADMYAYLMGSRIEGITHDVREDYFVSAEHESEWGPLKPPDYVPGRFLAIHLCQDYDLHKAYPEYDAHFNKHEYHERDPAHLTILSCDASRVENAFKAKGWKPHPLLLDTSTEPPVVRRVEKWTGEAVKEAEKTRVLWLLWNIRTRILEATAHWRSRFCPSK